MSRRRDKVETDGGDPLAGNPFAALDLGDGLPKGEGRIEKGEGRREKKPAKARRVEVRREKAGRGGKTVTTLREFPTHVPLGELDALCRDLKKSCACGGVLKGRVIELQGDVRDRIEPMLEKAGYKPVRAGG